MLKRSFDLFLALLGLIIFAPLIIIISLVLKIFRKGPVLRKDKRVGKNQKLINLYKFQINYEPQTITWFSKSIFRFSEQSSFE